jgi:histone H2A
MTALTVLPPQPDGNVKKLTITTKKKSHNQDYGIFSLYIRRVLSQVHPDTSITKHTLMQLNDFIIVLAREISCLAHKGAMHNKNVTVTSREIMYAIKILFPEELLKRAISEGTKAVTKWNAEISDVDPKPKNYKNKKETTQRKAGLTFSVKRCEKQLRIYGGGKSRVGKGAPIYLAAVLEYISAEILELSGNAARDNKLVKITARHLFLAIFNDEELSNLMNILRVEFSGSGVLPKIQELLMPGHKNTEKRKNKKVQKKDDSESSEEKDKKNVRKPHRFRPGTVSIREIRKYQKSTYLLSQKLPFERNIRKIAKDSEKSYKNTSFRFSDGVPEAIQAFVEFRLVKIFESAQHYAIISGRMGISGKDIIYAKSNAGVLDIRLNNSSISNKILQKNIPQGAIKRIARRGGVRLISRSVYEEINIIAASIIYSIINSISSEVMIRRVKTVSLDILKTCFPNLGYNFII